MTHHLMTWIISNGDPRAFGNYVAQLVYDYGLQDGSNEENDYKNSFMLQ